MDDYSKLRKELEEGFDRLIYSFGSAPKNSIVPFKFEYKGKYDIESVRGTCSCTDLKVTDNIIEGTVNVGEGDSNGVKSADITVYFLSSEPDYLIKDKVRTPNPAKITINLRVTGKVLK